MEGKKEYPTVLEFLQDGYGEPLATTLMDVISRYGYTLHAVGIDPGQNDAESLWQLCTLLKCILKDEFGVDLDP